MWILTTAFVAGYAFLLLNLLVWFIRRKSSRRSRSDLFAPSLTRIRRKLVFAWSWGSSSRKRRKIRRELKEDRDAKKILESDKSPV